MPRPFFVTAFAMALYQQLGYLRYLELGVHIGETLQSVGSNVPDAKCYGVDDRDLTESGGNVQMYYMTTQEYLAWQAGRDGPFNVAYIDADHAFESVKADFLALYPHMADQSLILLDDTWPGTQADTVPGLCNDAYRMAGWLKDSGYESVTIPCEPGLTIVRKSARHLGWVQ
jgi:predicted O-methyltransferase YrrM